MFVSLYCSDSWLLVYNYMPSWSELDLNSLRVNCDNSFFLEKLNHSPLQRYSHWRFPVGLEIGTDFMIFSGSHK